MHALFKKVDVIILSLLLSLIYWLLEATVHYSFFNGSHLDNAPMCLFNHPICQELLHPNPHELYMRLSSVGMIVFFGCLMQRLLNKQRFLSTHDPITHLPNIRVITPTIQQLLQDPHKRKGCFAIIKLNHLSLIQRILGTDQVNYMVCEAAHRLKKHFKADFIGMLRFAHFVFYLDNEDIEHALQYFINELHDVFDKDITLKKIPFHMERNVGIVKLKHARSCNKLINLAYKALEQSYLNGSDFFIYNKLLDKENKEKLLFVGNVYTGIKKSQFVIYLQPKIDLISGDTSGFEVLSRWLHPEKGLIPPKHYIKEAEESQAIYWLTLCTVKDSIQILENAQKTDSSLCLSLNLSALVIGHPGVFNKILNLIEASSINPMLITFEITESAFIRQPQLVIKNMNRLHKRGFKISLDDFGTGYSSFTYLKNFPVDEIKIDASFIKNIEHVFCNQVIVRNLIILAKELSAKVCAEGVETQEVAEYLKELGCHLGQGYLWSKPLPYKEALTHFSTPHKKTRTK